VIGLFIPSGCRRVLTRAGWVAAATAGILPELLRSRFLPILLTLLETAQ
jgi:hypothetical protein